MTEMGASRGPEPVDRTENPEPAPPLADRTVDAAGLQAASGGRTTDASQLQQRPGERVVDGGELQQADRPHPG